jgi:hypothetical protein
VAGEGRGAFAATYHTIAALLEVRNPRNARQIADFGDKSAHLPRMPERSALRILTRTQANCTRVQAALYWFLHDRPHPTACRQTKGCHSDQTSFERAAYSGN